MHKLLPALTEQGLILKKGTIVDSTIISAPSSTKNKEKKRDPDAHQVKKGNTWHFGYKAHVGVDKDSGLVHTVEATPANVHDVTQTSSLLTGEEDVVYGDSGYLGAGNREDAIVRNKSGRKIKGITAQLCLRPSPNLLPHPCSYKRGKYIQYSRPFILSYEAKSLTECSCQIVRCCPNTKLTDVHLN